MTNYKSKVYTQKPAYADFESPAKFEAIKSIIARRLTEYPTQAKHPTGDQRIQVHAGFHRGVSSGFPN